MKLKLVLLFTLFASAACSAQSFVQVKQVTVGITNPQISQGFMEVPITWTTAVSGSYDVLFSFSYLASNKGPRNCLTDAGYRDIRTTGVTIVLDVCAAEPMNNTDKVVVTAFVIQ